ncbi:MAG: ribulokinase [Clostridiaceae bacterium]|nr:ribulokinase [Clostridiaceae bacterium]
MAKYTLGLDFGTLSARALLVRTNDGCEIASVAADYAHGVMDKTLPDGTPLGEDWALQIPSDYMEALRVIVPGVLAESGVDAADVIGIGVDFTSCTLLPAKSDGTPLCEQQGFSSEPNAYAKLWKHHAAQKYATIIGKTATERREAFLQRYGGRVSSEAALPKIWQILDESPDVYAAADCILEAGDWLVWQLCGRRVSNAAMAGYKAYWGPVDGYPSVEFLRALNPGLANAYTEKMAAPIVPSGAYAGGLTEKAAAALGLCPGTAVAAAHIDAHVTLPAVKVVRPGQLCAIMGTSTCHILLDRAESVVPGFCGVAADGAVPGYFALEAGQCCVGDHFAWFVDNCVPESYVKEAQTRGLSVHALLTEKMARLVPGESGLLALDWWNGNRSVLVDANLTGLMLGMTLRTTPEEMYRALVEATAYGTRMIVDAYRGAGVPVTEMVAAGGIARKNPTLVQIYADVLRLPIRVGTSKQSGALGSAIFAAAAAGAENGGLASVEEAAERMGAVDSRVYLPKEKAADVYDKLYAEYKTLHDYFGRGENDVMKRLRAIKAGE